MFGKDILAEIKKLGIDHLTTMESINESITNLNGRIFADDDNITSKVLLLEKDVCNQKERINKLFQLVYTIAGTIFSTILVATLSLIIKTSPMDIDSKKPQKRIESPKVTLLLYEKVSPFDQNKPSF